MRIRCHAVWAVFRRSFYSFFANPTASSSHAPPGFKVEAMPDLVRWQSWSYRPFAVA